MLKTFITRFSRLGSGLPLSGVAGSEAQKKMADALRSGAKMLADACPVCSNPLFDIKGEIRCISCDKKVVKVKEYSEVTAATTPYILRNMDAALISKIEELTIMVTRATDVEEARKIGEALQIMVRLLQESRELQGDGAAKK